MKVDPSKLVDLYDERYAGEMKFQTSPRGLHSTIVSALGTELEGRDVLDIGCGAGRLALFCATRGARVTALDFSATAIELARVVSGSLTRPVEGVEFRVGRFEDLDRSYAVVLMTEVFEHIETEPRETLRKLGRLVAPGGLAVVSTPGFVNFRGIAWMTLQNLFGFLMSPSDVHFVHPWDMESWCADEGFQVAGHLGLFHDWGWGEWSARDMKRRIALALRDQRRGDPRWEAIDVDLARMDAYLDAQSAFFENVLTRHAGPYLRRSVVPASLEVKAGLRDSAFGHELQEYLGDASVPFCADPPLNAMGATNVYLCRRL
jgi:2-polyprenyl-3-methyl-5-hydroxy-6-metoxy-1,4-benzoquinol methylase